MQTERLSTLDEFGSRRFVIPAEVTGPFRKYRNRVYSVLLIIFLALPWIKINGLQAVMIDIPNRHFEIFGQLFLSHDSPLLFFILALGVLMLALVTAVWGRVWCGWACPQTVFIDGLYRKIEIWIEGDYIKRRKLQNSGMTFERLLKSGLKWFVYLVVSSLIAHSFIAYFTGSNRLVQMIQGSPKENWNYFLIVSAVTAILLFNFGWFREQFCTIMCPYGRFQSVLMDDDSLTVLYDETRGERRKGTLRDAPKRGDCVSCNRCVEVCPAGIDIRNGVQMECIACTACIDACNIIMKRVNKPQNLIRYQSLRGQGVKIWRPRVVIYSALAMINAGLLAYFFATHAAFTITVLRGQDMPYQTLTDGTVLNHLKVHLFNQSQSDEEFSIRLSEEQERSGIKLTQAQPNVRLGSAQETEVHLFVALPLNLFKTTDKVQLNFIVNESHSGSDTTKSFTAVGPRAL